GAAEALARPGVLLARRREGAARHRPQDAFDQAGRSCLRHAADRSGVRRGPAAQVGGHAAVVPAARGPEAGSPRARPHHRPGTRRLDDLRHVGATSQTYATAVRAMGLVRPALTLRDRTTSSAADNKLDRRSVELVAVSVGYAHGASLRTQLRTNDAKLVR